MSVVGGTDDRRRGRVRRGYSFGEEVFLGLGVTGNFGFCSFYVGGR